MKKTWTGTVNGSRTEYSGTRRYRYKGQPGIHKANAQYRTIGISAKVELTVDVAELLRYVGERALRSSVGKSKMLGGIIVAKVTSRTETPGPLRDCHRSECEIEVTDDTGPA